MWLKSALIRLNMTHFDKRLPMAWRTIPPTESSNPTGSATQAIKPKLSGMGFSGPRPEVISNAKMTRANIPTARKVIPQLRIRFGFPGITFLRNIGPLILC
jgi:hypothetical protein